MCCTLPSCFLSTWVFFYTSYPCFEISKKKKSPSGSRFYSEIHGEPLGFLPFFYWNKKCAKFEPLGFLKNDQGGQVHKSTKTVLMCNCQKCRCEHSDDLHVQSRVWCRVCSAYRDSWPAAVHAAALSNKTGLFRVSSSCSSIILRIQRCASSISLCEWNSAHLHRSQHYIYAQATALLLEKWLVV